MEDLLFSSPHALLVLTIFFFLFPPITSQTCQKTCGDIPLRYPFGSGSGCGDPRFHPSITCNDHQQLIFTTHTGCYPISNIDYTNQVLYISDPTMSTCACNQPSKGFGLDWDAPFSFHGDTIFALLDCSSSSPVYAPNGMFNDRNNSSRLSLCDSRGLPICGFLYGCKPIVSLNIPISGCCVYTPVNFGPSFEMDLEKLKCGSYSGFYSFNGRESDAESWKYGIALKYKFAIDNVYPSWCSSCEQSGGICGYSGPVDSFICNCPPGFNTTTNCFFGASYNGASNFLPNRLSWIWLIIFSSWLLVWSSKF
ncbi:unnamed protein product [Citrullus colocynthis]|uniref:non-specific serine/threonine protein kinase n=1 Tax=Citrullus colocynthis TaxID=252529 RepID=A0ABP0Y131_9ROSI